MLRLSLLIIRTWSGSVFGLPWRGVLQARFDVKFSFCRGQARRPVFGDVCCEGVGEVFCLVFLEDLEAECLKEN